MVTNQSFGQTMNSFAALVLPAVLGLVAGIGHGFVSHYADLPMSLSDQIMRPMQSGDAYQE